MANNVRVPFVRNEAMFMRMRMYAVSLHSEKRPMARRS
jgi:hypothetical protein